MQEASEVCRVPVNHIYLALGSNVDKEHNIPRCVRMLARRTRLLAVSRAYETAPVDGPVADTYLNAAAQVETDLPPEELKRTVLREIERELGRVRTADRNAPRPIDIDIVLVNHQVCEVDNRRIPDPEILSRAHVVIPLAEIAPDYVHPETGESLAEIAARFAHLPGVVRRQEIDLWL